MVNFGPLAAEIVSLVGTPLQISTAFASWQRYCTVLQQWASAKLCGVEQRVPSIFGRAAITLGIGPHSSIFVLFLSSSWFSPRLISAVAEWTCTCTHDVALVRIENAGLKCTARGSLKYRTQK